MSTATPSTTTTTEGWSVKENGIVPILAPLKSDLSIIIIQYAVWRQVQSLFQNDSSTWCDPKPPLSNESILSCP